MKSLAKYYLTEMPMDFGVGGPDEVPDWIHPGKKRKIERGEHPYAENPAWPTRKPPQRTGVPYKPTAAPGAQNPPAQNRPDPTRSYSELISSHTYPEIIKKIGTHIGRTPQQMRRSNPGELMHIMMQSMHQIIDLERPHRRELEQAAVDLVLGLPEFVDAREAVAAGDLRIEARLIDGGQTPEIMRPGEGGEDNPNQMRMEPDEEPEERHVELGLDVPEIKSQYDLEAQKRRFINMMTQGAAINKNYAYHQIADQLQAIDPGIMALYGKTQSISELMYWMTPEEGLNRMMGSNEAGGVEEVNLDPDGVFTIRCWAVIFPCLIQEVAKGLYEFLAHNEDDPADTRGYAYNQADTLPNEQFDIMKGPGVWRHFNKLINDAGGTDRTIGVIWGELAKKPTGQFLELMRSILEETPEGLQYLRQQVAEIREEDEGQRLESLAYRVIRRRQI